MMMFYAEQPVDWLMTSFRLSMGQRPQLLRKPTLFQHFGTKSSFDTSKDNDLKDRCETRSVGDAVGWLGGSAARIAAQEVVSSTLSCVSLFSGA